MSQKIYLWILKVGSLLAFMSVFLINKNFLFPYITSKQIYFNILIELLAIFWVALIVKYPEWRPKKSYITCGLIGFFVVMLASCFTSVDWNLSYWGDIERMLGFFQVVHFLFFYLIIITVMRTKEDWKYFMIASVVAAVINALYGLTISAFTTIGNTAYVSGYMIFNLFFAVWLFIKEEYWPFRVGYALAAIAILQTFLRAHTSGAHVGLAIGIFVSLFLYALLVKNKKLKIYGLSAFAIFIIAVIFLFATSNSLLKDTSIGQMIRTISVNKVTFQTRLISWTAAAKDFKNHPILGTGYGNFAIIFDKYFTPKFYDYTRGETYFDRAHNNVVDIASTTGGLGLLSYLLIFVAAGYYLVKGYREDKIDLTNLTIISGVLVAYFVQNLAVFDSLVTYISLMMVLGYLYWLVNREDIKQEKYKELNLSKFIVLAVFGVAMFVIVYWNNFAGTDMQQSGNQTFMFFLILLMLALVYLCWLMISDDMIIGHDKNFENKELAALIVVGLIMLTIIYQYNLKFIKMLEATIDGQRAWSQGDMLLTYNYYKTALSYNTPLDRDSRSTFLRLFASGPQAINITDKNKGNEILDFAISEGKKNIALGPHDSMMQMELAQVYETAAEYNYNDTAKAKSYSDQALEAINKSIDASPGRVPIYFIKSQIYMVMNDQKNAIDTLRYATSLSPTYYESFCQLANVLLYYKDAGGYSAMDTCIDKGGVGILSPAGYVKSLAGYYADKKDWPRAIACYERLTTLSDKDASIWADLAKLYSMDKQNDKAREAALKAAELNPDYKTAVDDFIKNLK